MGARNFAFGATAGCDCDSQLMLGLTPRSIVENHLSNRHTEFHQEVLLLRSSLHATQSLLAKVWKLLDPTWEPLQGVCFVAGRCIAIQSWSECGIWTKYGMFQTWNGSWDWQSLFDLFLLSRGVIHVKDWLNPLISKIKTSTSQSYCAIQGQGR